MRLESNASQIARRGFLTLGALGAVALITPQGAFALDGVPAGASNIIIEPIENGWRVRDTSTGEVGTIVFPNGGRDSIATMPDGEVIYTCWSDDGTVTQNGVVVGQPEPQITPFASIPAGFTYLSTVHYDFTGLDEPSTALRLAALLMPKEGIAGVLAVIFGVAGELGGYASNFTMDLVQYVNWNTNEWFNVYKCYKNGRLFSESTYGPSKYH